MNFAQIKEKYCFDALKPNLPATYKYLIQQTAKQNKLTTEQAAEKVFSVLSKGKSREEVAKIRKAIDIIKKTIA